MKLSFKLYILVTLYKINLCMSNIISLKYYFLCENELVWREFSKKFEISKKQVPVHGHGHGRTGSRARASRVRVTGTGVRVCTGFFLKNRIRPF